MPTAGWTARLSQALRDLAHREPSRRDCSAESQRV